MADPYNHSESGVLARFGLRSRGEAVRGIERLLAEADTIRAVSREAVAATCRALGADPHKHGLRGRRELYGRYLRHCLEDHSISQQETDDLQHLRHALHLRSNDVTEMHDTVAREVYGRAIEQVLDDLELDDEEERFLQRLRSELQLSDEEAQRLWERGNLDAKRRGLQRAQAHDPVFHTAATGGIEVTGVSDQGLEAAITNAVEIAHKAMNGAAWFELLQTRGRLDDSGVREWHVEVRVGRTLPD